MHPCVYTSINLQCMHNSSMILVYSQRALPFLPTCIPVDAHFFHETKHIVHLIIGRLIVEEVFCLSFLGHGGHLLESMAEVAGAPIKNPRRCLAK